MSGGHSRPGPRSRARLLLVRTIVVATMVFGVWYLQWRWTASIRWEYWWISVPLVVAETYSLLDAFLFGTTMWRLKTRGLPSPPEPGATVDVFVTTYNEPVELVMATARAAQAIRHPHSTWVLDDGAREEMRAAAEAAGVGYLTRSADWADRPRHAKAGNLNNALAATDGEYLLILDADQIPDERILDHTLGWFRDPEVALVQTPQWFVNVDDSDPLGSQAPLFYGPIQQGKDGWNAAFFCGSNAVIRREALMQVGLSRYATELEQTLRATLRTAGSLVNAARKEPAAADPAVSRALDEVAGAVTAARRDLKAGEPLAELTARFHDRVEDASAGLVATQLAAVHADLAELVAVDEPVDAAGRPMALPDEAAIRRLARSDLSPLAALESVRTLVRTIDVTRDDEAQPVMPMATISVTEDMATAMRLHAAGWRTVYHHELLARGLAPEDLGTMLQQRLRWAQGTLQVLLRENPLTQKGLSLGQRLMYFATMWSYLAGFAAVIYILAPVVYLLFGVRPVRSYGNEFLTHLIPYLVSTQLLFVVIGYGIRTWRGQQYSLALFPVWIRACVTAVANVRFGRPLGFVVTPKTRQEGGPPWRLIRPQLAAIGLLLVAVVVGTVRWAAGVAPSGQGTIVNIVWVAYDLLVLSVIVQAARYTGPKTPANEESV